MSRFGKFLKVHILLLRVFFHMFMGKTIKKIEKTIDFVMKMYYFGSIVDKKNNVNVYYT